MSQLILRPSRFPLVAAALLLLLSCGDQRADTPTVPTIDLAGIDPALTSWSSNEHLQFLSDCLEEKGFHAEVNSRDQSIAFGSPQQGEAASQAMTECMEAATARGLVDGPPEITEKNLRIWYAAYQITQRCLIDHGYPVVNPPSVQSYVESRGENWHPYDAVPEAFVYGGPGVTPNAEVSTGETIRQTCTDDMTKLIPMLAADGGDEGTG